MDGSPPVLTAETITKSFRQKTGKTLVALDSVSFSARTGGVTALVGPDGAGKTTLLRIVAGLVGPDTGSLLFERRRVAARDNSLQSRMGYMPQQFGLYEDLTVQENLDLYADLRSVASGARADRFRELLAMSALEPFRKRLAGKLSGGMKQKLGLICTLVAPPDLLILDEPTVGVDPLSRRELWEIIHQLTDQTGMTAIVSTSYMDEAAGCDEVVLLFEGKTLAKGTPESIRQRTEGMGYLVRPPAGRTPRSLQADLLGTPGVIDAVPQGGAVRFVHGTLTEEQERGLTAVLGGAAPQRTPANLEDSFMLLLRDRARTPTGPPRADRASGQRPDQISGPAGSVDAPSGPTSPRAIGDSPGDSPGNGEPVIETEHVSRLFGDFIAVNDVSFSVYRGEVFGLLGPNGAGKTTTFRMLCGLLPASKGRLRVAGVDVRDAREEARRHLGYVAQKFSLYGPLSVRENLDFFAGAYGLRGKRKSARIREVAEDFSLEHFLDTPADALPGGNKRRLAMAVGLLHEPAILFLDEPTSGADPLARRDFWKRISRLADQGVTIVVTTHFMEEAEYCDRVLIQDKGVMLALGTPAEIRARAARAAQFESGAEPESTMEDAFIHIVVEARAARQEHTT